MVVGSGVRTAGAPAATTIARRDASPLHPLAWLAWLASASAAVFLTSNPLYLSLGFLVAGAVYLSVRDTTKGRTLTPFVVIGLALAAASVPFNVLTGSSGPTVLATVPGVTSPTWFGGVTFGGAITAEALVTATSRATGIATLVLAAAAFNAAIDHFRLLRLAPRFLPQLMLSMTIALLVIPQSVADAKRVAEARRLRGRGGGGLASLPALLLPALQGALERSVQRAESLDARGFGSGGGSAGAAAAVAGVAGLGLCAWGAFSHFYSGPSVFAGLAMATGAGTAAVAVVRGGATWGTRLRADVWTRVDGLVAATALLAIATLLALRVSGAGDVTYLAYPEVVAPAFHAAGAFAFLLLLAPMLREVFGAGTEAIE